MKSVLQRLRCWPRPLAAALLAILVAATTAAAAEAGWRPTYDIVMRWVNFLILAAVIVKFARRPLKDFLSTRREEISIQIQRLEGEKQRLQARLQEARDEMEKSASRFEALKAKIAQQGERERKQILEQARLESRMLMESARRKVDHRLRSARETLRNEMIDAAYERALKRLPDEIRDEDNQRMLQQYLASASAPGSS